MSIIEDYITLKQRVDRDTEELKRLGDTIKERGAASYESNLGTLTVSPVSGRKTVRWELVCAAAQVPQALVDRYTKIGDDSFRITVAH